MLYDDYLAHHGVKGQKWGVRRYQNEDGTYTDRGRKHRRDLTPEEASARRKKIAKRVAIGVGSAAAAAGAGFLLYRNRDKIMSDAKNTAQIGKALLKSGYFKEVTKQGVSKLGKAARKASTEVGKSAWKTTMEAGKEAKSAMMVAAGGLLVAKIADKFDKMKTGNSMHDDIISVAKEGALAATKSSLIDSNNGNRNKGNKDAKIGKEVSEKIGKPSNKGIDKQSKSYQSLFKGRSESERATIKALAKQGYDEDQIRQYLSMKHSAMLYGGLYLAHHGVKGQKWGVRRYQNEDGSYTDAGQKHRATDREKQLKKMIKKTLHGNIIGAAKIATRIGTDIMAKKLDEVLSHPFAKTRSFLLTHRIVNQTGNLNVSAIANRPQNPYLIAQHSAMTIDEMYVCNYTM